jgi:hypothetical protein
MRQCDHGGSGGQTRFKVILDDQPQVAAPAIQVFVRGGRDAEVRELSGDLVDDVRGCMGQQQATCRAPAQRDGFTHAKCRDQGKGAGERHQTDPVGASAHVQIDSLAGRVSELAHQRFRDRAQMAGGVSRGRPADESHTYGEVSPLGASQQVRFLQRGHQPVRRGFGQAELVGEVDETHGALRTEDQLDGVDGSGDG